MNLFFSHWAQHLYIPKEVKSYFREHARIKTYTKGSIISNPFSGKAVWCYVCKGLVAGNSYNEEGEQHIHWFAPETHHFTSTKHLFTSRRAEYIEILQTSKLLKMNRNAAITGQQEHAEISEIFHILKHRRLEQYQARIAILNEKSTSKRYAIFMDSMPEIAQHLTINQVCQYLRMSSGSHYAAQLKYSRENPHQ